MLRVTESVSWLKAQRETESLYWISLYTAIYNYLNILGIAKILFFFFFFVTELVK